MIRSPTITVMTDAVRLAARSLKRDFGEVEQLQVSVKGPGDFVSAADLRAEEVLRAALVKARPGYGLVLEEGGVVEGSDRSHRWHVDPLDGTTNFLHGIPHCCISVGLERDGQVVAGIVYDFIKDELFIAERGQGAWMNNRRLRVSARRDPSTFLIATGIPWAGQPGQPRFLKELALAMPRFAGVRRMGVAALDLAYGAAGRFEAYWENGVKSYDIAAGIILVREAGGFVTDTAGRDVALDGRSILAGNEAAHPAMLETLKAAA